jgi:hypothetical protein
MTERAANPILKKSSRTSKRNGIIFRYGRPATCGLACGAAAAVRNESMKEVLAVMAGVLAILAPGVLMPAHASNHQVEQALIETAKKEG